MDANFAPSGRERLSHDRSELTPIVYWAATEVPDINADALAAVCGKCKARLSWAQWLNATDWNYHPVRCHRCHASIFSDDPCLNPTAEEMAEVAAPGYLDRIWYHASRSKDWAREVRSANGGNLLVHAGSRIAALSRADYLIGEADDEPVYLHSFRLRSTRRISTVVLEDMMERWQAELDSPFPMDVCPTRDLPYRHDTIALSPEGYLGAVYYNRYEVPGAMSMLFHAPLVQLNTVKTELLGRRPAKARAR